VLFTAAKTLTCHFTNSFGVIKTILQLNIPPSNLRRDGMQETSHVETKPSSNPGSSSTNRTSL
jgi:hypothetical protein